jgi:hypothetical protein
MSGGWGAFAQGLGNGLFASQDMMGGKAEVKVGSPKTDVGADGIKSGEGSGPFGGFGASRRQPQGGTGSSTSRASPSAGDPRPTHIGSSASDRQPSGRGNSMLWDLVDNTEGAGNYDTLYGHSQNGGAFDGVRVSEMTLGELRDFSNTSGEYGQWVRGSLEDSGQRARVATPMGRWQIVGTTMRNTQAELGMSDDTVFDANTQRQMADHLAGQRLAGATTMGGKMTALRQEWEGFGNVSDRDLTRAIQQYENRGL